MSEPIFPIELAGVVGVDDVGESFTIDGDKTAALVADRGLVIINSTGNDGQYTVVSSSYAAGPDETTVVVAEDVTDATVDGTMLYSAVAPYPRSKVSNLEEMTSLADKDLLYASESQGPPEAPTGFISKFLTWASMQTQNDARYVKEVDVFLNPAIPALIIRKN